MSTSVFQFFDRDYRQLFATDTADINTRFANSAASAPWWRDVTAILITHYDHKHDARFAMYREQRRLGELYNMPGTAHHGRFVLPFSSPDAPYDPGPESRSDRPHALYRVYSRDMTFLYVGVTADLAQRLNSHQYTQPWWKEGSRLTVELYPHRRAAQRVEQWLIREYGTAHNKIATGGRKRAA